MWKYIIIIVILIVVVVAIVNVAEQIGKTLKFGDLGSLVKFGYQSPSLANGGEGTSSIQVEKKSTPPVQAPSVSIKTNLSQPTPPEGFTVSQLSPFYGEVKISGVSISSYYGGVSQVSLNSSYSLTKPADVTGWMIKSNRGSLLVPQAVLDFTPYGFGDNADIVLNQGGYLTIYNAISPISRNLKINECMGYLNNVYEFTPSLECNVGAVYDRSEIATFSGACQNYIMSLGGCTLPTPDKLNFFSNEPSCQSFLTSRFSYAGCYNLKRGDPNFFTNQWIVWSPGMWSFDSSHDRLLLFDGNGLLVDEYVY